MLMDYLPIFIFFVVAAGFALVTLFISAVFGRRKSTPQKMIPYECGMDPFGEARKRFSVRFYIVAMIFIVFDIEAVFLYPWAVAFDHIGLYGLIEMVIFIVILLVGYFYAWKKGALEWE